MNKRVKILVISLIITLTSSTIFAQHLLRSEFIPYNMRTDATTRTRSDSTQYAPFNPTRMDEVGGRILLTQDFDLPYEWSAGRTYIHLENLGLAHSLIINGSEVAYTDDPLTPAEYNISKYLHQGVNQIAIAVNDPLYPELQEGVAADQRPTRERLENCYLFAQGRRDIHDYSARIYPDSTGMFARLEVIAVVENGYNFEESIEVSFDIYDPKGKLVDYSTREVTIEGRSRDSVIFNSYVYNADVNRWSVSNPALYEVTLMTKSSGVVRSYLPMKVAYMDREYRGGELYNFGKKVSLKSKRYNATSSKEQSAKELAAIKKSGVNTLRPDYPQPLWYYELADAMGLFVVEQININAPSSADDRSLGGTPSNNPKLLNNYIERAEKSYYRVKNHPSVVAFSMGGDSGNGYNMYKTYEWFKGVEPIRPIIYGDTAGEWNSDRLKIIGVQ
ncbi:MAG: glycoside hydrolase family 2 TIM barrel-domain containing protein [Rikenellaceae bacterium]